MHLKFSPVVSAEEVISAVGRFTARRFSLHLFINDNFKLFKAAKVRDFLFYFRIKWSEMIILFYERSIAVVKSYLKKVIGKVKLDYVNWLQLLLKLKAA